MELNDQTLPPPVGLFYDERMCKHDTPDGEDHPEQPLRIKAIWRKLESQGIPQRCRVFGAKEADEKHIGLVHTQRHIDLMREVGSKAYDSKRKRIAAKLNSIYLNEGTSEAAYLAAGAVIEASEKVASGELRSVVAIVRPPGHHAEADEAMGFCIYNNLAIAASVLLNEKLELNIKKILIVDWDVHHGNGIQKMFDFGTFYPSGDDGSYTMIGEGLGTGYNINVPWEHGRCGDADYLAVWEHILIPIARAFGPDITLISGGFDAG
ncbi:histone deacetylase [Ranunculus cassubicifolius]